jgi:DNA-binding PadR family transcriptional regulator
MSGYDMKAFISRPIGFFWAASYGQLYPTLKKLLEGGYVSRKIQPGEGKPSRHVYSITNKGRRKLSEWFSTDTEPEPIRNELLLKLFFASVSEKSALVEQIRSYQDQQERRLKTFGGIEKTMLEPLKNDLSYPLWASTVRYGIHIARARIRWCKETLSRLSEDE